MIMFPDERTDPYCPKSMMNRKVFLERCAQGAMLGVFLHRFKDETEWRRGQTMTNDFTSQQERAVANRLIWC